jgi:8-hydroxy-5-deazaflavin:NADPH oxidoreductase
MIIISQVFNKINFKIMKIAILGTGSVAQTFAEKLISLGHQVMLGTRNVANTLARGGNAPFADWQAKNPKAQLGTFAQATIFGEMVINALNGGATITALTSCNASDFKDKILLDVSNPLDFSKGFPPSLIEGLNNTHSLGEEIQKTLPDAKVVKTLNTMWAGLMVNPMMINDGKHINFICGNDADAKAKVKTLLGSFGWAEGTTLDLGDITNARGTEAILPIWTRIYGAIQTGVFNFGIVK